MATILELARHADLPTDAVIRALNGEPVSDDVRDRVAAAVEQLGQPDTPVGASRRVEVLFDDPPTSRGDLAERIARATQPRTPEPSPEVGSIVSEALRAEVEPVGEHLQQLESLFVEVLRRLRAGRRERVEDLELLTELVIEGWRGVDRRLGRIEKILARLEHAPAGNGAGPGRATTRIEDLVEQPPSDSGSG